MREIPMRRPRREQTPGHRPASARSGVWGSRACLLGGVVIYLALAVLARHWRPDEPFIAFIWVFLAAHSAAYLLVQELRRYGDEPPS
jgi:hypothetical protein